MYLRVIDAQHTTYDPDILPGEKADCRADCTPPTSVIHF